MPGKSQSRTERSQAVRRKAEKVPPGKWVTHSRRYQQTAESMQADLSSGVPCPELSHRFHTMSFRRAIEAFEDGRPALSEPQMFWRTAGARFLHADSSCASRLADPELESQLAIANAGGRDLKKYVADLEGDPVMSPQMLSRSSRRAYLSGWLPNLGDEWLFHQGGLVVALTIGDMAPTRCSDMSAVARAADAAHAKWSGKYLERVSAASEEMHSFCAHAQAAYKSVTGLCKRDCPGRDADLQGVARNSSSCLTVALRALKKLERDLTETLGGQSLGRWVALDPSLTDQIEVCGDLLSEPDLVFLRDVRRMIACLSTRPRQPITFESATALARSIWYLHVGIAWVDALYDREQINLLVEFRLEPLDIDEDTKWVSPCLSELPVAQEPFIDIT